MLLLFAQGWRDQDDADALRLDRKRREETLLPRGCEA
jgi:hypothetical protein